MTRKAVRYFTFLFSHEDLVYVLCSLDFNSAHKFLSVTFCANHKKILLLGYYYFEYIFPSLKR